MLFWAGIVRHRLSANQIFRCLKLKKIENYVRYHADFLLPLKLQKNMLFLVMIPKYSWPISLQDFLLSTCLTAMESIADEFFVVELRQYILVLYFLGFDNGIILYIAQVGYDEPN